MEQQNNTPNFEIVSLERARFTDTLPAELDTYWNQLVEATEPLPAKLEVYGEIWKNREMPQVFRDRALIRYMSHDALRVPDPKKAYNKHISRQDWQLISPIYEHNLKGRNTNGYFHPVELEVADWLIELDAYQKERGVSLVPESARFLWTTVLFNDRHYDETEFDAILETFDPAAVSPTFMNFGKMDEDTNLIPGPLDDRFTYLDHIFRQEIATPDMERLREWAVKKLHYWLDNYDDVDSLPSWMQNVDKDKALPVVQEVLQLIPPSKLRKMLKTPLDLDSYRHARNLYSWEDLFGGTWFSYTTGDRWLLTSALRRLNGEIDLEEDLLAFIMSSKLPYVGDGENDVRYVRKVANRIGNQALIDKVAEKTSGSSRKPMEFRSAYDKAFDEKISELESELQEIDKKRKQLVEKVDREQRYKGLLVVLEKASGHTSN